MRISYWSSVGCSPDLLVNLGTLEWDDALLATFRVPRAILPEIASSSEVYARARDTLSGVPVAGALGDQQAALVGQGRSEEHTSELQSLMRISYAVFCLKKKKPNKRQPHVKSQQ